MIFENRSMSQILKYIALATSVYIVFRFVPNQPINNVDALLIASIITLVLFLIEYIFMFGGQNLDKGKQSFCNTVCSVKGNENMENMTNVATEEGKKEEKIPVYVPNSVRSADQVPLSIDKRKIDSVVTKEDIKDYSYYSEGDKHGIERKGSREEGVIKNEMNYSDYHHIPLPDNYESNTFESGYSMLPPEQWYPQPPFPPVCVTDKKCPVCPVYSEGAPANLLDWHESTRITPPDNIKSSYVKEKLNSGR